jgi:hypothetical protein
LLNERPFLLNKKGLSPSKEGFPLNGRPFSLSKKPLPFNKKGLPLSKKGLSFNGRPFSLSKKPFPFNKKGLSLNKKGLSFNGRPFSLSKRPFPLNKKGLLFNGKPLSLGKKAVVVASIPSFEPPRRAAEDQDLGAVELGVRHQRALRLPAPRSSTASRLPRRW